MENYKGRKRLPAPERKKVILDAAMRTFVEFGYHGALMDTIAERAQVTKPILYRHFPSKMALLLALLDEAADSLRNSLLEPLGDQPYWRTAIEHHVHSYFDFVKNHAMHYRLVYSTDLNVDHRVFERITKIRYENIALIAARLRSFSDPKVENQDIEIMAVILEGMGETAARHWMNNQQIPVEAYEENLIKAMTNILAAVPGRKKPPGGKK